MLLRAIVLIHDERVADMVECDGTVVGVLAGEEWFALVWPQVELSEFWHRSEEFKVTIATVFGDDR